MDHKATDLSVSKIATKNRRSWTTKRQRLTATAIKGLDSTAERYEVGDPDMPGLQLRIDARHGDGSPGAKVWQWRFMWKGKRQKLALGPWPEIGQRDAHERVRAARALLERGIDPRNAGLVRERGATAEAVVDGKPVDPHSVAAVAQEFMRRFVTPHRKRPEYVQRILEVEVLKDWRTRDVRSIKPRDVIDLLDGIVDRGSRTMANRTASILAQLFKFAVHRSIIESTPVQLLYRPGGKEKPRDRVLGDDELRALLGSLDKVFARAPQTASAIRVALLTACRRSELALARWSDVTLTGDAPVWRIPPENSKTGIEYITPLVPSAVAEFKVLKKRAGRSSHVLPADAGDGPADPKLLTRSVARHIKALGEIGVDPFTLHDMRRTVRTGLARLKVLPHIAERVLNHAQADIVATYDVHQYLDEKRDALQQWSDHLDTLARKGK